MICKEHELQRRKINQVTFDLSVTLVKSSCKFSFLLFKLTRFMFTSCYNIFSCE